MVSPGYAIPPGANAFIMVRFVTLDINQFQDSKFSNNFRKEFRKVTAEEAEVKEKDVIIHAISSGSVVVESSLVFQDMGTASAFTQRITEAAAEIFEPMIDDYGDVQAEASALQVDSSSYTGAS